jgi:two-component system, NtrC family, response regulator HydG
VTPRSSPRRLPVLARGLLAHLEQVEEPAIVLSPDYRVLAANASYRRRYGEVDVRRQRCFEVSHGYASPCDENGETCPLRATLETGLQQRVFHVHHGPEGPSHVDVALEPIVDERGQPAFFLERIREVAEASVGPQGEFVGRSPRFREMLGLLHRAAPSEVPVLLLGETGTGKELAARALHRASTRRAGPFVPVDCSGLAETLFESELFGHEAGAFTGATRATAGLIEAASGGTLFLDELGDVPLSLQVKLLRLIESRTYRRVGSSEVRRANFRLICATHRDLEAMVRAGTFRQDLLFRVNVFPIVMPRLAERAEDLAVLCRTLLVSPSSGAGKRVHPTVLARLADYPFPGNVRELRNILERMSLLADGDELRLEHLPEHLRGAAASRPGPPAPPGGARRFVGGEEVEPLADIETAYVRWACERLPDRRAAARALGLSDRTLYRKLAEPGGKHS